MYERNAIVIDRFFSDMFGYGEKSNIKNNYTNYCDMINKFERYQEISNTENNVMIEFEQVANEIKETQKMQESFYKKNIKLQETRRSLFDNLDDKPELLQKKFEKIESELNKNNIEIKENIEKFITKIAEFNEKSERRTQCGRERRIIEKEYQISLKEITDNFSQLNLQFIELAKKFLKQDDHQEIKEKIKLQILKNGEKEKIAFNTDVVENAIDIATDIEAKKLEILVATYEKTLRILNEIKNDAVKIDRHQKFVKDSKCKLEFLNMVNEYIILFLDNERMTIVGGKEEHKKLMDEACQNMEKDLVQIKNMYNLLLKEITGRSTKKAYKELYNPEYLQELLDEEKQFERSISKLNVVGTIIYPNYWRIEGMQKIYETFKRIVTDSYGKDLSEYEPIVTYDNVFDEKNKEENADFNWYEEHNYEFKLEEDKETEENDDDDDEELEEDDDDIFNFEEDEEDDDEFELEDEEEDDDEFELEDEEEDDDEFELEEEEEDDDDEFELEEEEDDDDDDEFESDEDEEDDEEDNDKYENFRKDDDDYDEDDRAIDEILGFYNNGANKNEDKGEELELDDIDFELEDEEEEKVKNKKKTRKKMK